MKIKQIPESFFWLNEPEYFEVFPDGNLIITAGKHTDWFRDPGDQYKKDNAPVAVFSPIDETFCLSAKLEVNFKSKYDAGVLMVYENKHNWAKFCFEYSPADQPMIVSVVTQGVSDDCNSVFIEENSVFLRIYRNKNTFAFHYSSDGKYWHLVRYFSLNSLQNLRIGFSSQSPTGEKCQTTFSEIKYLSKKLSDLRNGE